MSTTPNLLRIERMTLDDIPAVAEIEKNSFPLPWPPSAYRYEIVDNDKAYFIVAKQAQPTTHTPKTSRFLTRIFNRQPPATSHQPLVSVVGFAGMWNMADEAHIATIASHPRWRGRGIGERLLLHLLREAQRQNCINSTLEVRVSNTVAQTLYKKCGFEEVGYRKAYYQDNREDALIYTVTNFQTRDYATQLDQLETQWNERQNKTPN